MDLRALDLNLLLALDRLLSTGNVTAAARALGVTQPAMSRSLQRLRTVLADPLLVRAGRRLVPTERARALVPLVRAALDAAQQVFSEPRPFHPATATGHVRIALGDEAQTVFTDAILDALWKEAPRLDVRFCGLSVASVEQGRRGEIDLAVTPDLAALPGSDKIDLSDFVVRPLYTRRFVVVCSRRRSLPRGLAAYAAADHLIVGPEGTGRGFVDDLLEARGLRRRVAASVATFTNAVHVIARTELIATMPEEVARTAGLDLRVGKPPLPTPTLPIVMVWHPRTTTDPRHRFIRETIARAMRDRLKRS